MYKRLSISMCLFLVYVFYGTVLSSVADAKYKKNHSNTLFKSKMDWQKTHQWEMVVMTKAFCRNVFLRIPIGKGCEARLLPRQHLRRGDGRGVAIRCEGAWFSATELHFSFLFTAIFIPKKRALCDFDCDWMSAGCDSSTRWFIPGS